MEFEKIIEYAAQNKASDIHFVPGQKVFVRLNGQLQPMGEKALTSEEIQKYAESVLDERGKKEFAENMQYDFVMKTSSGVRLRGNVFKQDLGFALSLRLIPSQILDFNGLGFPEFAKDKLLKLKQGFVIIVGPTGQGKTTTAASLLQERGKQNTEHLITIEDPIEYIITSPRGIVQQRTVGKDVRSFKDGIKSALREDPNILFVGEMRDLDTISSALTMAETGHVVVATLHTNNGPQTITRIVDMFPAEQQDQVRSQLAGTLTMVVSQRLVPSLDGGRQLVYEILSSNYAVQNYIRTNKIFQIPNVLQTDSTGEMVQFEQTLTALVAAKRISKEVAFEYAQDGELLKSMLLANGVSLN